MTQGRCFMMTKDLKYINFSSNGIIGNIVINRPEALNSLNLEALEELEHILSLLPEDLRVLEITGAGDKAFVAGADIALMKDFNAKEALQFGQKGKFIFDKIEHLPFPVIAVVNGYALGGGCELALACDLIIASRESRFGLPEVSLGIIPGFGGIARLIRRVGFGKAKELIFSAKMITAEEAVKIGLVNQVIEAKDLQNKTNEFIREICKNSCEAVKLAKRALNAIGRIDPAFYELENDLFSMAFSISDAKNRMEKFLQK